MTNNKPLVSICIPTYNGAEFIEEALNSALEQTYKNIEIVVSDDSSNDNTLSIIRERLDKAEVPFAIYNHDPKGIGANWNYCVEKANGTFVKFLFQDDLLRADCIEKMVELAMMDDKVGLVYCKRTILHNQNNFEHTKWIAYCGILHQKWSKIKVEYGIIDGKKYLADLYLMNGPLNKIGEPTAVLLRKKCFDKTGYFDEDLKQTLDIEFWYRIMKYFKIGFIDENLVSFRLHDNQATFINKRNEIDEIYILKQKFYKNIFWQFHPQRQWKLFKTYSTFGDIFRFFKRIKGSNSNL